jgi:DNA-binding SARP family transcriptional activator
MPTVLQASLCLFGAARLALGSKEVRLERKTAAVLAYLALEGATPKYKLAGLLWPDSGETAARNNMRQLLRRFRAAAGDIITGDDRIELNDIDVDVKKLSYLETPSLELLKQDAVLLEGFDFDDAPDFADWLESSRQDLFSLRSQTAEREATRLEQSGNFRLALDYALLRLKLEPLAEEAYRHVAKLQYLQGDRSAALATLERCRKMLREEFRAQPLAETRDLQTMIESGALLPSTSQPPQTAVIPASVLRPPVLAGREREWEQMEQAWQEGKLIFLSGDAGSGKSRLATDFLTSKGRFVRQEARPGDVHVPHSSNIRFQRENLRRYPDYQPPLWVKQALAPYMPELEVEMTSQGPSSQTRYAEANLEILKQNGLHGEAMFLDDFQFMDEASVQLGLYMFSQLLPLGSSGTMPGFIAAFRRAELTPFLEEQIAKMVESGMAVRIELGPLPAESIARLVQGLGLENAETLVPGLARYTGGNPLFILETLKYLIETNALAQGLPPRLAPQGKVATLIGRRLQRLSPSALNLARVASVAVTDFALELAAFVLERPSFELAEAHAELETSQILRGNAFSHDLVFEAVLANIPAAIKQLLHLRTAKYLETLKNSNPAVLAQHYFEGGDPFKAAECWLRAAHKAQLASLLKEGRDFAERAIQVYQHHRDPREYEATTQLFEILGIQGSFEDLVRTSDRLVTLARTSQQKLGALTRWTEVLHMTRHFSEALEKINEALKLVAADDLLPHAQLRQTELYCCLRLGHFERAKTALDTYKTLATQLNNLEVTGSVMEDEGVYYAALDEHEKAISQFNRLIAMIDEVEQYHFAKARILSRRASSEFALGLTEEALADVATARAVAQKYKVVARGFVWPWSGESYTQLALGNIAKAWEAAQEAERYDKDEDPKVTYLVTARVLHVLGQEERAIAELEAFLAQQDSDATMNADVLLLLSQITGDALLLEQAEQIIARVPKPDLQIRLALAKVFFVPPGEVIPLLDKALEKATAFRLRPLEASLRLRKAQALLSMGRAEEARGFTEEALKHHAFFISPAEIYFTAYQVYEALQDTRAKAYLEKAQTWLDDTAKSLPKELRKTFLNQPLHKKIL